MPLFGFLGKSEECLCATWGNKPEFRHCPKHKNYKPPKNPEARSIGWASDTEEGDVLPVISDEPTSPESSRPGSPLSGESRTAASRLPNKLRRRRSHSRSGSSGGPIDWQPRSSSEQTRSEESGYGPGYSSSGHGTGVQSYEKKKKEGKPSKFRGWLERQRSKRSSSKKPAAESDGYEEDSEPTSLTPHTPHSARIPQDGDPRHPDTQRVHPPPPPQPEGLFGPRPAPSRSSRVPVSTHGHRDPALDASFSRRDSRQAPRDDPALAQQHRHQHPQRDQYDRQLAQASIGRSGSQQQPNFPHGQRPSSRAPPTHRDIPPGVTPSSEGYNPRQSTVSRTVGRNPSARVPVPRLDDSTFQQPLERSPSQSQSPTSAHPIQAPPSSARSTRREHPPASQPQAIQRRTARNAGREASEMASSPEDHAFHQNVQGSSSRGTVLRRAPTSQAPSNSSRAAARVLEPSAEMHRRAAQSTARSMSTSLYVSPLSIDTS